MFFDFISPIVVKEIRQGLKSRFFSSTYLILQGLMVFSILLYLTTLSLSSNVSTINGFFWLFLGIPLVLVMPIRAFNAINEENKNKTLELIHLTKLTSWNIVFGKWLAILIQSALILVAVMPYMTLRYFLGGINLTDDIITTGMLIIASAMLTGIGVGMSSIKKQPSRILLIIIAFMSLYIIPMLIFELSRNISKYMFANPLSILSIIAVCVLFMFFMIEFGASMIAPPAENHSARKRLWAISILAGFGIARLTGADAWIIYFAMGFIFITCCDAITETPRYIPSIYIKTKQHPLPLRMIRRLFYPGWQSGMPFTIMVIVFIALFVMLDTSTIGNDLDMNFFIAFTGAIIFPQAIILLIRPSTQKPVIAYFVMQVSFFILTMFAFAFDEILKRNDLLLLAALPPSALIVKISDSNMLQDGGLLTGGVTLLSLLIIAARACGPWSRIISLERGKRDITK